MKIPLRPVGSDSDLNSEADAEAELSQIANKRAADIMALRERKFAAMEELFNDLGQYQMTIDTRVKEWITEAKDFTEFFKGLF